MPEYLMEPKKLCINSKVSHQNLEASSINDNDHFEGIVPRIKAIVINCMVQSLCKTQNMKIPGIPQPVLTERSVASTRTHEVKKFEFIF